MTKQYSRHMYKRNYSELKNVSVGDVFEACDGARYIVTKAEPGKDIINLVFVDDSEDRIAVFFEKLFDPGWFIVDVDHLGMEVEHFYSFRLTKVGR